MICKKYKGYGVYISTGNGFKAPLDGIIQNLDEKKYNVNNIDFFKELGITKWDNFWHKTWDMVLARPKFLKINYIFTKKILLYIYREIHFRTAKKQIYKWLETENPDFIISSHFITTLLLPYVIKKSGRRIPVFAYNAEVVSAHDTNIALLLDKYFSPTKESTEKLIRCGQPSKSIRKTPFPIDNKFKGHTESRVEARKKMGLSEMFTVLISFGGDGLGSVSLIEMVAEQKLAVQIIAICGRSEKLLKNVNKIKKAYPDAVIHPFGFVDNMPDLMSCSDICAGKAGMNATFESIYMKKPYMATFALFNEEATLDFIVEKGFGWDALEPTEQLRIIESCLEDPGYYNTIIHNISNSGIDFDASGYNQIITEEVEIYKHNSLKNSKALYFDMAGTLCDIPITGIWDEVNENGIRKVVEYLKWNEFLNKKEVEELTTHFVEEKKKLRKHSKDSLKEAPIRTQLSTFIKHSEKQYTEIKKQRGFKSISEEDMDMMEKLFVSTELDITVPFEGVTETLEKLAKEYNLYLLSNNVSRQLVIDIVEKVGCLHCFKDIFVSMECGYRKPHINFLNYVTSKTNLKPNDCVMIGDRLTQDIRLANLHDLKSIYVAIVEHEDNEGAENEYYDYCIHDFKQLEDIFLK